MTRAPRMVVLVPLLVLMLPAGAQAQDAPPRVDWSSAGISLVADDFRLELSDASTSDPLTPPMLRDAITAPGEVIARGRTFADEAYLDVSWFERGRQELIFDLAVDESEWWIDAIQASDGHGPDSDWIFFEDLEQRTRTPRGESFEGDLRLASDHAGRKEYRHGAAELRLDGLRLTAFEPGMRPAPLTGCAPIDSPGVEVGPDGAVGGYDPYVLQGPGEPLEGLRDMTPPEMEAALQAAGLCYRFEHFWHNEPRFADPRLNEEDGGWEVRCSAPETGRFFELNLGPDYGSSTNDPIMFIVIEDSEVRDRPEPPPYGTDCPSQ